MLLKVGTKAKTLEFSIFLDYLGSNITFFWTNTTDSDGHNVNYIGREGQTAVINGDGDGNKFSSQEFYNYCLIQLHNTTGGGTPPPYNGNFTLPPNQILPSGNTFKSEPENPNQSFTLIEKGLHYFYCGRPYHCLDGGVKATIKVVEHVNECHIHPNC